MVFFDGSPRNSVSRFCKFLVFSICVSVIISVPGTLARAQSGATTPATDISISSSPAVLQPTAGKLPTSVLLLVTAKGCGQDSTLSLEKYSIQIAAAGLSLPAQVPGKCAISGTMKVDPSAPAGNYKIVLLDPSGRPSGTTDFSVMDASSGAIPSGLAPEVDVIWGVLSQGVCRDVFGKRVAGNFYCIEVKVGNNTGHPLQLAGIGFATHPDKLPDNQTVLVANTSYASTRAVLLREEVLSPRNIFYHSLQASGLIMGGLIPYFHAANASAHYSTAVAIVTGPLLQAFNIIGPDRVVGQLNNLDDESFRDSQIIPNNTQIRTIVFVEKRALSEQIEWVGKKISPPTQAGKGTPERLIQDESERAERNSEQKAFHAGDFSPLLVKLALGNLVVVGDEIEYLERVQVQGNAAGSGVSPLTITPLQLDFGNQNVGAASTTQALTITNSGSSAISSVSVNVAGTHQNDFSQTNSCGASLATGANCKVTVTFTPSEGGARGAAVSVSYPTGTAQTVTLTGVGIPASGLPSLGPATLSFDPQKTGTTSSAKTITLTNSSSSPLTGITVNVNGNAAIEFAQTSQCGATLNAAASCTIPVTFKPTATGMRQATLIVTYTLGGAQHTPSVNLRGTGQ
jgi:hypothetical protein